MDIEACLQGNRPPWFRYIVSNCRKPLCTGQGANDATIVTLPRFVTLTSDLGAHSGFSLCCPNKASYRLPRCREHYFCKPSHYQSTGGGELLPHTTHLCHIIPSPL